MSTTAYAFNGVDLPIQPTSGQYGQRKSLGVDGNNVVIYEPIYSFTMTFDALTMSEFNQLYDFWQTVVNSGSISVDLPQKDADTYVFKTYTSCVVDEPTVGAFFQTYVSEVKILVRNITV